MQSYVLIIMISAVGSALVALPNVGIFLAFVTFGFGLIFSFLPSLTYYLVAMIPGVALGARTGNRLLGTVVCLVFMVLAAIAPVAPDFLRQKEYESDLVQAKIATKLQQIPRTIEIIRPERFELAAGAKSYPEVTCMAICRHLIESDQIDWMRFLIEKSDGEYETIFFHAGKNEAECKVPGESSTKLPCVLVKQDNKIEADLQIGVKYVTGEGESIFTGRTNDRFNGWLRFSAISNMAKEREIVYSNVQQSYHIPNLPFALTVKFGPTTWESGGFDVWKSSRKLNQLDYNDMLTDLGYVIPSDLQAKSKNKPKTYRDQPNQDQTRALLSLLDLPTSTKFTAPQMKIVADWVFHARRYQDWNAERVELVKRIYLDPRVGRVSYFDQVARKNNVAKVILPLALQQLMMGVRTEQTKQLLWSIRLNNRSTLLENKDTIAQLLNNFDVSKEFYGSLVVAGAYVGINPKNYIGRVENNHSSYEIQAYCYLEPAGNDKSTTELRSILANPASRKDGKYPDDQTNQALRAMASHGATSTIRSIIKSSDWINQKQQLQRLYAFADDREKTIHRACRW